MMSAARTKTQLWSRGGGPSLWPPVLLQTTDRQRSTCDCRKTVKTVSGSLSVTNSWSEASLLYQQQDGPLQITLVPLKAGLSCYYRLLSCFRGQALFLKAPRGNPDCNTWYINKLKWNWITLNCSIDVTSVYCYLIFISHRESKMLLKESVDESDWVLYILFWLEIRWVVSAVHTQRDDEFIAAKQVS